jgi:hypothetical protein
MACWLYQMANDKFSHGRYRTEVWEGNTVTNWWIGESKRKPTDITIGDIVILFYSKTSAEDPGIYGWGVITMFDGEVINFRPASPSDYLKMNPLWNDGINKLIDKIRGGMPQMTMWKVEDDILRKLRNMIALHVYGISE